MAADEAEAQMHPGVAHFKAFLTALRFGFYRADLVDMRTDIGHLLSPRTITFGIAPGCGLRNACCPRVVSAKAVRARDDEIAIRRSRDGIWRYFVGRRQNDLAGYLHVLR